MPEISNKQPYDVDIRISVFILIKFSEFPYKIIKCLKG